MSKLEAQKALPRRKLFRVVRDELGQVLKHEPDYKFLDRPKVRKAKKAKRK